MPASAWGLPLKLKLCTVDMESFNEYAIIKVTIVFDHKYFEPIDVITLRTPWWPQLHSTYHRPQVSSIYFMRFLCIETTSCLFMEWRTINSVQNNKYEKGSPV